MLRGRERHELACASCGAPLHDLKMLRKDKVGERELVQPSRIRVRPKDPIAGGKWEPKPRVKKAKYRKKRKGFLKWAFEEAFDVIEDIFD